MSTKYILLIIGILGILSSIAGLIQGQSFSNNLVGFICGSSLIWGYFELKKKEEV
jgi:hypothetical protein